jgi:hypothetical protein
MGSGRVEQACDGLSCDVYLDSRKLYTRDFGRALCYTFEAGFDLSQTQ